MKKHPLAFQQFSTCGTTGWGDGAPFAKRPSDFRNYYLQIVGYWLKTILSQLSFELPSCSRLLLRPHPLADFPPPLFLSLSSLYREISNCVGDTVSR